MPATSRPVAGPRLLRPRDQPRRRPFRVRAMRARHVLDLRRKPAAAGEADVRGDPPALGEDFDGRSA